MGSIRRVCLDQIQIDIALVARIAFRASRCLLHLVRTIEGPIFALIESANDRVIYFQFDLDSPDLEVSN